MSEHETADQWVRRCAERLQLRCRVAADLANELAAGAFFVEDRSRCPERAAEDLLRTAWGM